MAAACLLLCYQGTHLAYAPSGKNSCPVTISPCTHNIPCCSSCIIASCLLVAAGASQWPRYNETLWLYCLLHQPADPQLRQQQQIIPLFLSHSTITAWPTSPWLPIQNGCKGGAERCPTARFSECDLWLRRSGVRVKSRLHSKHTEQIEDYGDFFHPLYSCQLGHVHCCHILMTCKAVIMMSSHEYVKLGTKAEGHGWFPNNNKKTKH